MAPPIAKRAILGLAAAAVSVVVQAGAVRAAAEKIPNDIAVFAALDKVTARISRLEVALGQTVQFGSLRVTPRVCYNRPPTEQPKTTAFVEVQDVKLDGTAKALFAGWMFAESPGLNAVEHPVFDVWLTDCTKPQGQRAAGTAPGKAGEGDAETSGRSQSDRRRRVRR